MKGKLTGIETHCITGEKKKVEFEYEVLNQALGMIFCVKGGSLGIGSFYFWDGIPKLVAENGWLISSGVPGRFNAHFIPAEEMKKAMESIGMLPAAEGSGCARN
jgi:hypothetical protein